MLIDRTKRLSTTALVGVLAVGLAGAGGYYARAVAQPAAAAVNTPGAFAPPGAPSSFADIVSKVAPAVVSIDVVEKASPIAAGPQQMIPFPFGGQGGGLPFEFQQGPQPQEPVRGAGSGFFISSDGYIVTNNHVVDGAQKITVSTTDGRKFPAEVVGRDPATDLAVVKVSGGPFQYVSFEDRAKPRVGDWVVAVGNPFGLGGTATAGIVSALGRENLSGSSFVDYMQIDAPINKGNSGGPTFDVDGRVVGVNSAIFSPSGGSVGIGFDIPADVADAITKQLIANGKITRGYIGATIQNLSPDLADSLGLRNTHGALVAQLTDGGPAAQAGLQSGDVVTSVNGHAIDSSAQLTRQVALARPGQVIQLGVLRNGANREVDVRSGLRPSEAQLAANLRPGSDGDDDQGRQGPAVLGMQLAPSPNGGLMVQGLSPDSDASAKGLKDGDVILRAGERQLQSPQDLASAAAQAKSQGRKSLPLLVVRDGQRFYVPVQVAGGAG